MKNNTNCNSVKAGALTLQTTKIDHAQIVRISLTK